MTGSHASLASFFSVTRRWSVSHVVGLRLGVSLLAALTLTSGMFLFLRTMVTAGHSALDLRPAARIEFSRLRRDTDVESRREQKPKLDLRSQAPSTPMMVSASKGSGMAAPVSVAPARMGDVAVGVGVKKLMVKAGGSDRDVVPLVRIEPEYPARALSRGVEGWVQVRFTITPIGTVKDATVVESNPQGIFDAAAVAAVSRWKYNPKIEEGVAVERRGVEVILRFDLGNKK
jgi:periplasmic protein TonB